MIIRENQGIKLEKWETSVNLVTLYKKDINTGVWLPVNSVTVKTKEDINEILKRCEQ